MGDMVNSWIKHHRMLRMSVNANTYEAKRVISFQFTRQRYEEEVFLHLLMYAIVIKLILGKFPH